MHEKLYARMLRLYPAEWRAQFGAEMRAVFAEALRAARQRGAIAVLRLWWRELVTLPGILVSTIARIEGRPPHPIVAAALLLVAGSLGSHLVANAGLFHVTSLYLLATGLAASAFVYGAGRPIVGALVLALAFGAAFGGDRFALRLARPGVTSIVTIPGVRLDATRTASAPHYRALVERANASTTPRLRIATRAAGELMSVRVVRSGGVDGAYALLTMMLLAGAAWWGRRASRGPRLIAT